MNDEEIIDYPVAKCPECGQNHNYKLKAELEIVILSIANTPQPPKTTEITFTCPVNKKPFNEIVTNPPNYKIIGIADPKDEQTSTDDVKSEFDDWVKNSRSIGIDYCKTMLASSSGAVAVYFSIMTYMITTMKSAFVGYSIVPPIMFLLAVICFAFAIRPNIEVVGEEEFLARRAERLSSIYRLSNAGTFIFAAGICGSIVVFLSMLALPHILDILIYVIGLCGFLVLLFLALEPILQKKNPSA
jgi:hypothetical protein